MNKKTAEDLKPKVCFTEPAVGYLKDCSKGCEAYAKREEAELACANEESCGGVVWSACCHGTEPGVWAWELRRGNVLI